MDFKISREELYRWCSIPWQDLEKQPDLKTKLVIKEDRASMMSIIGNMMADEVIQHNAEGKLTKWVLPAVLPTNMTSLSTASTRSASA